LYLSNDTNKSIAIFRETIPLNHNYQFIIGWLMYILLVQTSYAFNYGS
jgi:hypothetical protein